MDALNARFREALYEIIKVYSYMGYWGFDIYENDDAHGWAEELVEVGNVSVIEKYIDTILLKKEKSDEYNASDALAAIDALTRINNQYPFSNEHPEELIKWLSNNNQEIPTGLYNKAKQALLFIYSDSCELYRLIAGVGEEYFDGWSTVIKQLETRVNACITHHSV